MFSLTCFVQPCLESDSLVQLVSRLADVRRSSDGNGRVPAAQPVVVLSLVAESAIVADAIAKAQLHRFFGRHILALLVLATNNLPRGRPVSHRSKLACVFVEILLFAFGPSRPTFHQFGFRRKRIHSGSDVDGFIKSLAV